MSDTKPSHDEVLQFMSDLDHGTNLFGPLSPDIRARLFAVVDKPNQETWADAHSIILSAEHFTTLWQALLAHTDYDVTSGPSYAEGERPVPWPKLPTSNQMLIAMRAELTATKPTIRPTERKPSHHDLKAGSTMRDTKIESVPQSATNQPATDTNLSLIVNGGWEGTYFLSAQFILTDALSDGTPVDAIVYDGDFRRYEGTITGLNTDRDSVVFSDGVTVELASTTSIHI